MGDLSARQEKQWGWVRTDRARLFEALAASEVHQKKLPDLDERSGGAGRTSDGDAAVLDYRQHYNTVTPAGVRIQLRESIHPTPQRIKCF